MEKAVVDLVVERFDDTVYIPALRDPCGDYFDVGLRAKIAEAIKRYPNTDAEQWIGPEAVLGIVEAHLGALAP